jgi:hypothetical protein
MAGAGTQKAQTGLAGSFHIQCFYPGGGITYRLGYYQQPGRPNTCRANYCYCREYSYIDNQPDAAHPADAGSEPPFSNSDFLSRVCLILIIDCAQSHIWNIVLKSYIGIITLCFIIWQAGVIALQTNCSSKERENGIKTGFPVGD